MKDPLVAKRMGVAGRSWAITGFGGGGGGFGELTIWRWWWFWWREGRLDTHSLTKPLSFIFEIISSIFMMR